MLTTDLQEHFAHSFRTRANQFNLLPEPPWELPKPKPRGRYGGISKIARKGGTEKKKPVRSRSADSIRNTGPVTSVLKEEDQESLEEEEKENRKSPEKKKMSSTKKGLGTPGGWRDRRVKKEKGEGNELKKGRYHHIMPDIGLGDEDDEGEEDEIDGEKKETFTMLTALADSGAVNRYCREILRCDGSNVTKTLNWLRSVDQLPESVDDSGQAYY